MDIKSGSESSFRVAFRPDKDATYYHSTIDVVAFSKAMRNFRLVTEDNFVPPWMVSIQVREIMRFEVFVHFVIRHSGQSNSSRIMSR